MEKLEDLGKRIVKLEVVFGRLKEAKDAKEAKESNEAMEQKEAKEATEGTSSGCKVEEEGKASECKQRNGRTAEGTHSGCRVEEEGNACECKQRKRRPLSVTGCVLGLRANLKE